jgi:hypothetical protein
VRTAGPVALPTAWVGNLFVALLVFAVSCAFGAEVLTERRIAAVATALGSVVLLVGVTELMGRGWGRSRSDAVAHLLEVTEQR